MPTPLDHRPQISDRDIRKGYVIRYFVQFVPSRKIYEVNKQQYDNFRKDPYYLAIKLPWVIKGNLYSTFVGSIEILSVSEQNRNVVELYNKKLPGLSRKLTNYLEYAIVKDNTPYVPIIPIPIEEKCLEPITLPREYFGDFQRFKYLNGTSIRNRPDAVSFDYKTAFTLGPSDIGANSLGLFERVWKVWDDGNNNIRYASANESNWSSGNILFTYVGSPAIEIDAAFEQLGRLNVVVQRNTGPGGTPEIWLYWFDPFVSRFVFQNFGEGRTPRISLDNWPQVTNSDILVFYVNDTTNKIQYRAQKDAFETVYDTPIVNVQNIYLERAAFAYDYRYRVTYSERNTTSGKYELKQLATERYPIPLTPESYFVTGSFVTASIKELLVTSSLYDPESYFTTGSFVTASIRDIIITSSLYDPESYFTTGSFVTASIRDIIITSSLYDPESYFVTGSFVTASTKEILITSSMYDPESYFVTGSFVTVQIIIP